MKTNNKIALSSASRIGVLALGVLLCLSTAAPAKAYTNSRLMDDLVFDNRNTMNEAQIQSFLDGGTFNGRKLVGPSTCLRSYMTDDFNWNGSSYSYGAGAGVPISAAALIAKVSREWGFNPQVIIATLQKEEALVTGTSCDGWRYNSAMGYACPDSGGCDPKYAGLTKQVLWGSWQLKFNKERSIGNTAWNGDSNITYVGYMTRGTFKRCGSCAAAFYDGTATIDGQSTQLETATTASMYTYTPHLGQSFPGIFEGWFGSTYSNISPVAVPHPDGTLVDLGGKVYLIQNSKRRWVTSGEVFISYGFSFARVKPGNQGDFGLAEDLALQEFREGTLVSANGGIYAIDALPDGSVQKRGFADWNSFIGLGYNLNEVMPIRSDQLPTSSGALIVGTSAHPDGALVENGGSVYLLAGAQRRWINSAQVFLNQGYRFDRVKKATAGDIAVAEGSVLSDYREGTVYSVGSGLFALDALPGSFQRRGFATWDIFTSLGYKLSEVSASGPSGLTDGPLIGP